MNEQFPSLVDIGFVYTLTHVRRGRILSREVVHNLSPLEARVDVLSVWLKGGLQSANWYLALFEGNYYPDDLITAATFAATATECTAYVSPTRVPWQSGPISADAKLDNSLSRGIFKMTANKTVYGGSLLSSSGKGSVTGKMASIARYSSPKGLIKDDELFVTAGVGAVSVNPA